MFTSSMILTLSLRAPVEVWALSLPKCFLVSWSSSGHQSLLKWYLLPEAGAKVSLQYNSNLSSLTALLEEYPNRAAAIKASGRVYFILFKCIFILNLLLLSYIWIGSHGFLRTSCRSFRTHPHISCVSWHLAFWRCQPKWHELWQVEKHNICQSWWHFSVLQVRYIWLI